MTLSKTAAIKKARKVVGHLMRRDGGDYVFYTPYKKSDIEGPDTEVSASTYPLIIARRTQCVADVALALMGYRDVLVEAGRDGATVKGLVGAGVRKTGSAYK